MSHTPGIQVGDNVSSYLGLIAETGNAPTGNRLMEACRDLGALRGQNDGLVLACEAALVALQAYRGNPAERGMEQLRAAIAKAKGAA